MKFLSRMHAAFRAFLTGNPIKTTWTSGGVLLNVTTYHVEGETPAQWSRRHIDALTTALAAYPPDA